MARYIFLAVITCIIGTQQAFAYIDPGSGSAIMSAIIGIFVAIGITAKTYWYKLKSVFHLLKSSGKKESSRNK